MRYGRLAEPEQAGQVAHAQLLVGEGVQHANARRIAQDLEGLGQGFDGRHCHHRRT